MSDSTEHPLGLIIYAAAKPIFKIYFIIALGYYLARKNILTVTTCRDIADAIVNAIMPCLIFENVVQNLKSSDIKNLGIIFFTGTLLFVFGGLLAWATYVTTRAPRRWLGGLISVGLFPNISDLPIAYLQTLSKGDVLFTADEGAKGVAYVCIFLASQVFYQFSLGLYKLVEMDFKEQLLDKKVDEEQGKIEEGTSTTNSPTLPIIPEPAAASTGNEARHPRFQVDNDATSISSCAVSSRSSMTGGSGDEKENTTPSGHESETNVQQEEDEQHNEFLRVRELERLASNPRSDTSNRSSTSRRSRRDSNASYNPLQMVPTRTAELRKQKSQDIRDVINEYSEFEALRNNEVKRSVTGTSEVGAVSVPHIDDQLHSFEKEPFLSRAKTEIITVLKNFLAPNSLSLIISLAIAMAPPLKALFVQSNQVSIPPAPDGQPPLSFVIDLTSYIGAASVPLGLLLLGTTISRLEVKTMPPGFWKTAVMITASRLILIPMIGVGITTGFYKGGWYGDDKLLRFVSVLEFGLPNATALVYFTAFYTDPKSEEHLQMDCLAVCLIFQYSILCITLPFLITFTLRVSLGM
ncbi:uncharacterized protein RJT20DRAFT_131862 [Scheffersomyces xylosifermentans]|uniref:uncharacterized protein n=1 Tax=Scheffersomyces xylosifermentans TaxID=1304137 RepID=UPI00315D286E